MKTMVSVVIPTYKRSVDVILNTINSVLLQTYKHIEIIIVDDNGNENEEFSKPVVEKLKMIPSVKYVAHETNKGACAARNTGILESKGEYIAFLDDDDSWEETKIEKQLELFSNSNVGLVYCGIKYYFENTSKTECKPARLSLQPCRDLLINNYIGSTSCGMVRKEYAIKVGLFDTKLRSGQDLDFWYRIAQDYELKCVEECLCNYTVYTQGTITSNYKNRLSSNIYLKKKYFDEISADKELSTVYTLKITKAYLINHDFNNAVKYFMKAIFNRDISLRHTLKHTLQ